MPQDPCPGRGMIVSSPVGALFLDEEDGALTRLAFAGAAAPRSSSSPLLKEAAALLDAYFAGRLRSFDLPLRPKGTDFQRDVWNALRAIPFGETRTYREIAVAAGRPLAFRAVGMANHANPIAIMIPCHRVIGSDGSLTGFGGGLDAKRLLLRLEGADIR